MLESVGYSVIVATNISAALTILRYLSVSAVLIEYKNEGMDSRAVALRVKQNFPKIPIILMSAYSDVPKTTRCLVDDSVMRSAPATAIAEIIHRACISSFYRLPKL